MSSHSGRALDEFAAKFQCPKCRSHEAAAHEVTLAANPISMMIPDAGARYVALSCQLCGYTEFYNMALAVPIREEAIGMAGEPASRPDAAG